MENMKLSAPWITFVHEIEALFEKDYDVNVKYDSSENILKLYVEDSRKADALTKLLPEKKEFGNIILGIEVIPANNEATIADLFTDAFFGNPAVEFVQTSETPFGEVNYIVFKNKVVQFFNDQLDDLNGNKSTLYENIARDVFGDKHAVFYCTEAAKELTKPLGEWP